MNLATFFEDLLCSFAHAHTHMYARINSYLLHFFVISAPHLGDVKEIDWTHSMAKKKNPVF